MKLVISERAVADLINIHAWIARDKPRFADLALRSIARRIESLALPGMAFIGRPGGDPRTRELVVAPYVVVYEVDDGGLEIRIQAVFHARQDR